MADIKLVLDDIRDSIDTQERYLCQAILRMEQDMPHYSDANFTMRLTYGQVGGYKIKDYDSGYYTTAHSLYKKMLKGGDFEDYYAEPEIRELFVGKNYGKYVDKVSKTLNLCFLTDNDITGGNSGSPVLDAYGRLIGLAFDGTWDSMANDIHFDKTLGRTINVDIRYVLYIMQQWSHANRIIKELGL